MTILIKGMELPEENHDYGGVKVWVDLRVYTDGSVSCCNLTGDFVDLGKCAVEVPTPHGRLIDADRLTAARQFKVALVAGKPYVEAAELMLLIDGMPTIIEAEV